MQLQHINLTYWPVALYVAPAQSSAEHMRAVMDETQQLRLNRLAHALVLDLTECSPLTPEQRYLIPDRSGQAESLARSYCQGMALVVSSLALRVTLNTILMLRPTPCPYKVFNDRFEALRWARAQMGDASPVQQARP